MSKIRIFTNDELQTMISREPIGNSYPYVTKDNAKIEQYIYNLYSSLKDSNLIECVGEFGHFGSGYASYVELFCYKKDGNSVIKESYYPEDFSTIIDFEGLTVFVSRLAPVAILSKGEASKEIMESKFNREESFQLSPFLHNEIITKPNGFMEEEFWEITKKLQEACYIILGEEYLTQPLTFRTSIKTLHTIPDLGDIYKVFDAIFYWSD